MLAESAVPELPYKSVGGGRVASQTSTLSGSGSAGTVSPRDSTEHRLIETYRSWQESSGRTDETSLAVGFLQEFDSERTNS